MNITDSAKCAKILKALGDESRLNIVRLLLDGEKNVSEIVSTLNLMQPQASHHLAILRSTGLVGARREGNKVFNFIEPGNFFFNNQETGIDLGCCSIQFASTSRS